MFSLKSKTYTKLSLTLSTITILFTSFYFIPFLKGEALFFLRSLWQGAG